MSKLLEELLDILEQNQLMCTSFLLMASHLWEIYWKQTIQEKGKATFLK